MTDSQYQRVSDVLPDTLNPWPDLPKEKLAMIANQDILIVDCYEQRIRTNYPRPEDTDGKHPAMFVKFRANPDLPLESTLLVSQDVLVEKLRTLKDTGNLPVLCSFTPPSGPSGYWNMK